MLTLLLRTIWSKLDDPAPFSQASKRFLAISKQVYFRARWFLTRYMPYEAIFYAIARPKIFDSKLLGLLLNGGAPLSRHLVQLLYERYCGSDKRLDRAKQWGYRTDSAAYGAVIERGEELYGDDMYLGAHSAGDDLAFDTWLRSVKSTDADVPPHITLSMQRFKFMPLPLSVTWRSAIPYGSNENGAEHVLVKVPKLAPLMVANGESPCCVLITRCGLLSLCSLDLSGYDTTFATSIMMSR